MSQSEGARLFREAWITGVRKHFPGEPKPGYVTPWEETPEWERQAAGAVHDQVRQFLRTHPNLPQHLRRMLPKQRRRPVDRSRRVTQLHR